MADPTTLTVQTVTYTAAKLTFANADTSNGNRWKNTGRQFLELVNNGATGEAVVTVATGGTVDGLAIANPTITMAVGERFHGVFPRTDVYNDANGYVVLTYAGDGAADVDVAVFQY